MSYEQEPLPFAANGIQKLEPEYADIYKSWKQQASPENNMKMLTALHPMIAKGVQQYTGSQDPINVSRGRQLVLDGLNTYDPMKAKLQTHVYNHLQGLKRYNRQLSNVVKIPERTSFAYKRFQDYTQELQDELGRDPTDGEIQDRTGFTAKTLKELRNYSTGVNEGYFQQQDEDLSSAIGLKTDKESSDMWRQMIYEDLSAMDKLVMEHTLGLNGKRKLSNQELALKLGRSPGAITQRKQKIQELLDQMTDF